MKYAVTRGIMRDEIAPFGECLPVVKETADYVTLRGGKYARGDDGVTRVIKRSVMFYTDVDITEELKAANQKIRAAYNVHMENVKHIIEDMGAAYAEPTD